MADLVQNLPGDVWRGFTEPVEAIAVAKLVVMPFVLTIVILLGWVTPVSSLGAVLLFAALMVPATVWNAGWRARTAAQSLKG